MTKNIKTIEEFAEWVKGLQGSFLLYRGLADARRPVEASAYRRLKITDKNVPVLVFQNYLNNLLEKARQSGLGHKGGAELCDLELLAELQHHGAATCLIDFTANPLIALWFACRDEPETNGKVIAMETEGPESIYKFGIVDSKRIKNEIETFFTEKKLWKWRPRDMSNRIIAQQSTFVFGKPEIEENYYETIIIRKQDKKSIIAILQDRFGISEITLFKDLTGFAQANAHDNSYKSYSAEDYFRFGVGAHQRENFEKAIEYYNKAVELNPKYAEAHNNRGIAKSASGDHQGAIKDYDKAIELNPKYAEAYNNRGIAKSALDDRQGEIADYNKAIELNPTRASAYYNRGVAKSALGDHQDAITDYNQAIVLNPNYAKAYHNRGIAKSALGNHESGEIADYDKAIELNPNYAKAYYNRGIAKSVLGDHKGAIADYDKTIELNPEYAEAYNNRGDVKAVLGNNQGAGEDWEKAIKLDPSLKKPEK